MNLELGTLNLELETHRAISCTTKLYKTIYQFFCRSNMASLVLTYSKARENLARLMDRVTQEREVAVITRRNKEDVVLLARDEFDGLMETVHLLRSPANRARLFAAMEAAEQGEGEIVDVSTLRHELGLPDDDV